VRISQISLGDRLNLPENDARVCGGTDEPISEPIGKVFSTCMIFLDSARSDMRATRESRNAHPMYAEYAPSVSKFHRVHTGITSEASVTENFASASTPITGIDYAVSVRFTIHDFLIPFSWSL
jgi:hypothetical protein